jgi:hypothetical protein
MKKIFKKSGYILLIIFSLSGCQALRDGLEGNKKSKNAEEFLINKKTPLSLPPNFDDLPKPISEANTDDNLDDFDIEKLLKKETNSNNETSKKQKINKSLNKSVIDKIKNN